MIARTIFISSRTIEVASERRAAYDAVVASGLVPLMFEAALNRLDDADTFLVPGGDGDRRRRVHGGRVVRDQVDEFVDRADLFLGIYSTTLGVPDPRIHNLRWVEYELFRFIAKHLLLSGVLGRRGEDIDLVVYRKRLRHAVASQTFRDSVRTYPTILRDGHSTPGLMNLARKIQEIVEKRVMLFVRRNPHEEMISTVLTDFLESLPPGVATKFGARIIEPTPPISDYQYMPSDVSLYISVCQAVEAARDHGLVSDVPAGTANHWVDLQLLIPGDHPGRLYELLREWFRLGFDVMSLIANASAPGTTPCTHVEVLLRPYGSRLITGGEVHRLQCRLQRLIESSMRSLGCDTETTEKVAAGVVRYEPEAGGFSGLCGFEGARLAMTCRHGSSHVVPQIEFESSVGTVFEEGYVLYVVNIPGMLWNITSLVGSYGCNIRYLSYSSAVEDPPYAPSAVVKIGFDASGCLPQRPGVRYDSRAFLYQLSGLRGFKRSHAFVPDGRSGGMLLV